MRIARFTTGGDPAFGVVSGDLDEFGQPADDSVVVELAGDPLYAGLQPTQTEHRLSDVRLLAPVIPRSKVVAIGRNYAAHAAELGNDVPEEPLMFLKPNTSVVGPGDQVFYPTQSERVDYEGELAVVIGKRTYRADLDPQAFADGVRIQTHLNGDLVQDGSTKDLIFDIPTLVAHITSAMTMLPGDVILTGTPEGIGPMQPGDEVEVSIDGLGALTNTVVRR